MSLKYCFLFALKSKVKRNPWTGYNACSWRHGYTWCNGDRFASPITDIQSNLAVPLFSKNEGIGFTPTLDELKQADRLFTANLNATPVYVSGGFADASMLPETALPEICFIGRSNVGKSSLIKALFYSSVKIPVSKTPGHTKALYSYLLGKLLTLVDMPGYGYNMPSYFVDCAEAYIKKRKSLVRTFLLLDATVGITSADKIGIEMLEEFGKPYSLVLTKIDKLTPHKVLRTLQNIQKQQNDLLKSAFFQPFLVSSQQHIGLMFLRAYILHITGNTASVS